jgi:N utilization substance protein A
MNIDMLRIIDGICREKNIEKEAVFSDLEQAIISAIRKSCGQTDEVVCTINRSTGDIVATLNGQPFDMTALGRIAAQTAKQVMIQKIREAERGSIYDEFVERKGSIVTGTVSRFEGGALVVGLGRAEGFLPRSEQIPGETHNPGERLRAMVLDVRVAPHQVKIILSRTHPDLIRRLFELEVPEVAERIIEIRALAREAGYRTKVAVSSIDSRVDAVGACVGVRGSRIKNIVDELGGEKIDIVRWNESSQILIGNALKPAEVQETALCFELNRATVVVAEDQLSLAIGKRGQNVRLAARLTGWDIDILTPAEYNKGLDDMEKILRTIEGVQDVFFNKLQAMGIISLTDLEEVGVDPLIKELGELGVTPELAERIISVAGEHAKRIAVEMQAAKEAAAEQAKAQAAIAAAEAAAEAAETAEAVARFRRAAARDMATPAVPEPTGDVPAESEGQEATTEPAEGLLEGAEEGTVSLAAPEGAGSEPGEGQEEPKVGS